MSDQPVTTESKRRSSWQQRRDAELADARRFLEQLKDIQTHDRGRMAALRRCAGEVLTGRGTAWFYTLIPKSRWRHREVYFLIATLFDFNRIKGASGNFGDALLRLARDMNKAPREFRRFHILIDAEFDVIHDPDDPDSPWSEGGGELAYRLRQTVRLMASHNVGVDWAELLVDLCHWTHPNRPSQKKWARTFFGDPTSSIPSDDV